MSAYIGMCLNDGAFLAADSRRTDVQSDTPQNKIIKKIYKLNNNTAIATGGLGTIGHIARERVQEIIDGHDLDYEDLILIVQEIFSQEYTDSLKKFPNHGIPLVAILAGKDTKDNKGFICSLSSNDNFKPFLIKGAGKPYFSGSNTNLVSLIASNKFNMMCYSNTLQLDRWAIESLKDISLMDSHVGFPIQLVKVGNKYIEKFPVEMTFTSFSRDFQLK